MAMGKERTWFANRGVSSSSALSLGSPHQAYNRNNEEEGARRHTIVQTLATRVDLGGCRETLEQCADALDALICAFAAVAVINNVVAARKRDIDAFGRVSTFFFAPAAGGKTRAGGVPSKTRALR